MAITQPNEIVASQDNDADGEEKADEFQDANDGLFIRFDLQVTNWRPGMQLALMNCGV